VVVGRFYQGGDVGVAVGLEKGPHAHLVSPLGGQVQRRLARLEEHTTDLHPLPVQEATGDHNQRKHSRCLHF